MKGAWGRLKQLLNERALRERVLIFAAAAGILGLLGYETLLRPAWEKEAQLKRQIEGVRQETAGFRARLDELADAGFRDRRERLRQRQRALRQGIEKSRAELGEKVGRFIRPRRLMGFFEDLLLARDPGGIQILRVESLEKEPASLSARDADTGIGLYRKGVAVGYRGTFADTINFLDRIAALPWAVQVTKLDYGVLEFPRARVDLIAHTFVLEQGGERNGR